VNDNTNIAYFQAIFRQIILQNDAIMFVDHHIVSEMEGRIYAPPFYFPQPSAARTARLRYTPAIATR
jgi:hypothetical protein